MGNGPPVDVFGSTGAAEADERIGKVFGEYRLTSRIGRGGMGAVYAAEHTRLGRVAAIKVIHKELSDDPKLIQRFGVEALTVAKLQHPNIVDVYDVRDTPEPHCVMELLRGRSLAGVLQAEGALPEARVLHIATQVLGALQTVHQRGIVHRDIKPDNIFLVDDGVRSDHVKLLDFGVAKILDGRQVGLTSTGAGVMLGTPLYMSPEQIEAASIDGRTDLYSFGLVMYEMVTGKPPFVAGTLTALLSKQLLEMPAPPPALADVIMRSIAKKPEERFAGAGEMLQALGVTVKTPPPVVESVGHLSTLGRASGEVVKEMRALKNRRRGWPVAAAGLAVGAAVLVALAVGKKDSPPPSAPAPVVVAVPSPAAPPPVSKASELLALAAERLAMGDAKQALLKAHEAVAAGAGREGWLLAARAACVAHSRHDHKEALAHLSREDAAQVECALKHEDPRPEAPAGAPIIE